VASPLPKLRKLCLSQDGVSEKLSHGAPAWFAKGRMFASFADDHHGDGRVALWCKADHDAQHALVDGDPERYFVPPYVGPSGWIGVRLEDDRVDWGAVAVCVETAWKMVTAPRVRKR